MLPAISDIVELLIVALQREARGLAEMRQVAAVPLVFQHIGNTAEIVSRVRWRRCGARYDEFEAKRLVGK